MPSPLEAAIVGLSDLLVVREGDPPPGTHKAIRIGGLTSEEAIRWLGIALTGLVSQAITLDLQLCEAMGSPQGVSLTWLRPSVESVIGQDNALNGPDDPDRTTERDPWIAEALMHILATVEHHHHVRALPNDVVARTEMPLQVKAAGIDLLTLHIDDASGDVWIGVTETKATELHGDDRLRDALSFLLSTDSGDRDLELRTKLNTLSRYVDPGTWARVPAALMSRAIHLMPAVMHMRHAPFRWSVPRDFSGVPRASERVRVLALPVCPWVGFFDEVCDAMRAAIGLFEGE